MKIIFEDNFKKIDENKWGFECGGHGWGNKELQYYTDRMENARVDNEGLVITGRKEDYQENHYTSAKLTTYNKFSFKYGIVEVVAKLPTLVGTWPAIWLLPNTIKNGLRWPRCGEIDIMEHVGTEPRFVHFSLHSEKNNFKHNNQRFEKCYLSDVFNGFHTYKMDWQENYIDFYYDNELKAHFEKPLNATLKEWPYDQEFFLILNLAIGGSWPGNPHNDFIEDEFIIKSVKVYK